MALELQTAGQLVDCAVYVDGLRLPGTWSYADAIDEVRRRGDGFVWVGMYEPDSAHVHDVTRACGLAAPAVAEAARAHSRPRLKRYDASVVMAFKTIHYVPHESPTTANEIVETGEVTALLGPDFIVTVRRGEHYGLHDLRLGLEAQPHRLRIGPAVVLHEIADRIVDGYLDAAEAVERDIEEMESMVFTPDTVVSAEQMYLMKREIVELRQAITPLAGPLRRLVEENNPLVPAEVRSYFRDVDDHLAIVADRVTAFDYLLDTLVSATQAKISLQLNTDVRKISSWVAILAVPTAVAGVYGMNFDFMPELRWKFGYPIVMTLTLGVCVLLHRVLSRKGWL